MKAEKGDIFFNVTTLGRLAHTCLCVIKVMVIFSMSSPKLQTSRRCLAQGVAGSPSLFPM